MLLRSAIGRAEEGDSGAGVMSRFGLICGVHSSTNLLSNNSYSVTTDSIASWIARTTSVSPSNDDLLSCDPGTKKKRVLRIMSVGDSITEGINSSTNNGFRDNLRKLLTSMSNTVVNYVGSHRSGSMVNGENEGWSGQEINFIRDKTMAHLKEYSPNVVTVLAGTNDIGHDKALGSPERLVGFVHEIRRAVPDAYVLVGDLLPDENHETNYEHHSFNITVDSILSGEADTHVVQVNFDDLNLSDMNGLHPNDAGYQKMADDWGYAIEDLENANVIADRSTLSIIGPRDGHTGTVGPAPGLGAWGPQGQVAWDGAARGKDVRWADMDGDGKADYLWVGDTTPDVLSSITWNPRGLIVGGAAGPDDRAFFADMDGDGRADYLTIAPSGATNLWLNNGTDKP